MDRALTIVGFFLITAHRERSAGNEDHARGRCLTLDGQPCGYAYGQEKSRFHGGTTSKMVHFVNTHQASRHPDDAGDAQRYTSPGS
jgi:hypothetical protein